MSDLKIPRVNKMQFGIIDENFVNRSTRMANEFADMKPRLKNLLEISETGFARQPILVKITESEMLKEVEVQLLGSIDPIRVEVAWKYRWKQVQVFDESTIIPEEDKGHPEVGVWNSDSVAEVYGENAGLAFNVAEMAHMETAPIIFGVDMETATYPAGFRPMPIADDTYVHLIPHQASDDSYFFYTFDRQGTHDGQCGAVVVDE